MGLSESKEAVLRDLVTEFPGDVDWAMIGSVDTVLRGLEDDPDDVDVLTTEAGARALREAFPEAFVERRSVGVSLIDEYRLHGEEVEVIFPDHDADGERLVDFDAVDTLATDDRGVPLLPLGTVIDVYRRLDKHETADRLVAAFDLAPE